MKARIELSVSVIFELASDLTKWPTLDDYLTRPISREHARALSPAAKEARQRARVRVAHKAAKIRAAIRAADAPNNDG
jgi:hypothetical protein